MEWPVSIQMPRQNGDCFPLPIEILVLQMKLYTAGTDFHMTTPFVSSQPRKFVAWELGPGGTGDGGL